MVPNGRELGIGDVVRAKSGDTSALYIGCRCRALEAELSHSAPIDPVAHRMAKMGPSPAISEIRDGWRVSGMNARKDRWSSGDAQLGRAYTASLVTVHRTPSSPAFMPAMGGLCSAELKVLVKP